MCKVEANTREKKEEKKIPPETYLPTCEGWQVKLEKLSFYFLSGESSGLANTALAFSLRLCLRLDPVSWPGKTFNKEKGESSAASRRDPSLQDRETCGASVSVVLLLDRA